MEEDEEEDKDGGGEKRQSRSRRHSLPSAVVSLAGPLDPPSHFEHEAKRGVHMLSTMARAAATPRGFALEAAERMMMSKGAGAGGRSSSSSPSSSSSSSYSSSSSSSSDVFDAAPELHRASLAALSPLACVAPEASLAGLRPSAGPLAGVAKAEARKGRRKGREEEEGKKTRFLFISSAADAVVPPDSSRALHAALEAAGRVDSRHVEYPAGDRPVGHADFVVRSWRGEAGRKGGEKMSAASAAPWAAEVEAVVSSL